MKNLISIDKISFSKENIIYFYKPEINYHDKFLKMMESLENDYEIKVFTINVNSDLTLPKRFNFVSVPCLIYYKNKKEFKKNEGMISYKNLKKIFRLKD